jgi:teichuronic acid biosynthesis glycosyltransferase TuaH
LKKIVYLMHVHWGWIKQRPQFIAEHLSLSGEYNVKVFCESSYRKEIIPISANSNSLKIQELFRLPYRRFRIIRWLNTQFYRFQLKRSVGSADVVWITYPYLYDWVEVKIFDQVRLVYDCMDDALEAPNVKNDPITRNALKKLEAKIVGRADVIFASSDNLKKKLVQRYELKPELIQVVNNAINIKPMGIKAAEKSTEFSLLENELKNVPQIKIMYLGTIAQWIDFELVHKSLGLFPEICYIFIGPKESNTLPHDRLFFFPPITQAEVFDAMQLADALIMPFEVSDFIQGVNPVKLYEYIYSLKPSIVVAYPETEKFAKYVNLYHSELEFFEIIQRLIDGEIFSKASKDESINYVNQNKWESRVKVISDFLT